MKKNKLTFVIAATCLVLGTLVGCNEPAPVQNSSKNDATSIDGGSEVIGSSDNSNNSQGGGNTSQGGGNTSQGGGNTSQGGGNTSQGGGDQPGKTDWSDAEKNIMKEYLHGYVLPFVNMDVSVTTSQSSGAVKIQSQQNMASGFLASYAAKFTGDSEWDGGDISSEYGVYPGNAYAFKRKVAQNGKNYYIAVMFTGLQFTPGQEEPAISKDGCFYLEAMDPYIYEYPAAFISQWMGQVYSSTIVPPAFQAEYYGMEEEGVLIGYSETNIEGAYKTALESSGNFTIDPNKNADGYYVARPSDSKYVLLFKYDVTQKLMIIKVEAPKGWNVAAINAIFRQYNTTPFALPAIEDQNIGFTASALESSIGTMLIISVTKVNTQMVQSFVNGLKTLGYKVASSTVDDSESQWFTTANVYTNTGMFTLHITYSKSGSDTNLEIMCNLDANPNVTTNWPAASIARYLEGATSTVPAFAGTAYGYSYAITNTYSYVTVHVDEGSESAARDSYIATLTTGGNGYVASGSIAGQPAFKSEDGHILVAISCNPTTFPGEIEILLQYIAVVDTPWPAEDIADAVDELAIFDPITDSIPALDVSDASECYVNSNFSNKFEINIDGLAASETDFIDAFKADGWTEDPYYGFDTTISQYGVLISPNRQLVAYFDTALNDLIISVKCYYDPFYETWPSQEINTIIAKWGVTSDALPSFDKANFIETNESTTEQKVEILVYVGESLKQNVITDYCIALERIGYHYDERLGGHISNNHELLIKFETNNYGVNIIVSCAKIVYKVVGYNNDWNFASGLLMTETSEQGNYKVQYSASFHVEANSKFKVLDSDNNWFGAEIASYSSANNDNFSKLEGGDIQVNAAGTVTAYFKIYDDNSKDMWLEFVKDSVPLAPWPNEQIDAALLGWDVDDEIPVLQDESISSINYLTINEKSFSLTVMGGASLLSEYEGLLANDYELVEGLWVPASNKIKIEVHAFGDDLIITVVLKEEEPEPEPAFKVVGSFNSWTYDEAQELEQLAEPGEGYLAQYIASFDVEKDAEFKVSNGADIWIGFDELEENEYFACSEDNHNIVAKQNGSVDLEFNILANGSYQIIITFTPDEPELEPWPATELLEYFGEDTFTAIPVIEIAGASYHFEYTDEDGSVKAFYMTVTVADAPTKMAAAIQALENEHSYSYDSDIECYVSSNEGLPAYAFDAIDDQSFGLYVAYFQNDVEETVYKLVGPFNDWDYENADGYSLEKVSNPEEGCIAQYTYSFSVDIGTVFKVSDGTLWFGFDELEENEYFACSEGAEHNIVAKQGGNAELVLSILSNGEKKIEINFDPNGDLYTWADAKEGLENDLPEGKVVPNLEVEGALAYIYSGSIDIVFAEDADMDAKLSAVSAKLEEAGYHYSRRFMGFVDTSTGLCFNLEKDGNAIRVSCSEQYYADDEGFGVVVLSYYEDDGLYYLDFDCVGEVNPSNESEYIVVTDLSAGEIVFLYDFTSETTFDLKYIDAASLDGNYGEYIEFDESLHAFVVKKDFSGIIYIKLSMGNDGVYVGFNVEP